MKNLKIFKLIIFIFICQFSNAQKIEKNSSSVSTKAIEVTKKHNEDIVIAKTVKGNVTLALEKEILQKVIQKSLEDLKHDIKVNDIKIAVSNVKTYYLAIVTSDNSKELTTLFLPLNNTDNSPNYYFYPTPGGHVVTCINITGCPFNCSIVKFGSQNQFTGCNCGGFDPTGLPANGNTSSLSCNFKINKSILERALCQSIKIKLTAFN